MITIILVAAGTLLCTWVVISALLAADDKEDENERTDTDD